MRKDIYEKMILTPEGNISSTRVMAWSTWKFTIWLNIFFLLAFSGLSVLGLYWEKDIPIQLMWVLAVSWWMLNAILMIAIYTPKQMAKALEIKQFIDLAGKVADKPSAK